LTRAGVLLDAAGLRPSAEGARIRLTRGRLSVTDGPFSESKEVIGGFALIEVATRKQAIEWGRRFLEVHGDEWDIECEVRQVDDDACRSSEGEG
jgi:hypothetical protein